ncbi:MAG: EAL domain-containing protein [Geminicoccaceae bacterium]
MERTHVKPLDWAHLPSDMALGFFLPTLAGEPAATIEVGGADVAAAVLDRAGTLVRINSSWRRIAELGGNTDPDHSLGRNYFAVCDAACGSAVAAARKARHGLESLLAGDVANVVFEFDCGGHPDAYPSLFLASQPVDEPTAGAVIFQIPTGGTTLAAPSSFESEREALLAAGRRMLAAARGGYRQPVMVVVEADVLDDLDLARLPAALLGPLALARVTAAVPEAWAVQRIGPMRMALCANVLGGAIGAGILMHRLRTALTPPILIDDRPIVLWSRFGGAVHPEHGLRAPDMLAAAERSLQAAATDGGPWFPLVAPPAEPKPRRRRSQGPREIARGALELRYTPRFDPAAGRMTGLEASVAPSENRRHVPLNALGDTMDLFVEILELIGSQSALAHWAGNRLPVGLAVTPIHLAREDFAAIVQEALTDTGVPPDLIELQIPEVALRDSHGDLVRRLRPLTELGVGVALDPFDGQDLPLAALCDLPVNVVRVADTLCGGWSSARAGRLATFLGCLGGIGHATALRGVTCQAQLDIARSFGCRDVQGPLLGCALPEAELDLDITVPPEVAVI